MRFEAASVALLSLLVSDGAFAQSVDQIVERNLKAKGGIDILRATNSVRMTAKATTEGAPTAMPMMIVAKRPNLFRREVTMGGQSVVQASDGRVLWILQPGAPATEIPNPQHEGEFDGVFVDYKARGTNIELVGNEPVEGKETYHLKVTTKEGAVQHIYLDAETALERKIVISIQQGGTTITQEQMPSDYREVDGRRMPFRIKNVVAGRPPVEVVVEKVEFNVPIDDAVFRIPK